MAAYFHGNSEIHGGGGGGDGLQTLILMNPAYGYSTAQSPHALLPGGNFAYTNAPPSQTPHFVGIPLQGAITTTSTATSASAPQDVSPIHGLLPPRVHYSMYNLPTVEIGTARDVTRARAQHGLSLSLSPQRKPLPAATRADDVRVSDGSPSSVSAVSNGVNGVQTTPFSSKYLKAAQELLEEVVNVEKTVKNSTIEASKAQGNNTGDSEAAVSGGGGGDPPHSGGDGKRVADLTTAERQEIQMKKAKLVNMLDEVEQRYRQYHHQMQIVITWFEQTAGIASAKTYTALALQTISKQFRCLKDAIMAQIRAATKSLGEDDDAFDGKTQGSRLKFIDSQVRHQTNLHQLGVIHHNTWRPQRGLPEQSVSVLRAWLFEHFLHPYPKDSDKVMLAKQTGLTRGQVSNWFINARVRLWKPMVEEMYMEEMKVHEKHAGSNDKTNNNDQNDDHSVSKSTVPQGYNEDRNLKHQNSTASGFGHIGSLEIESITQGSPKKARNNTIPNIVPSMNVNMDSKTSDHNVDNEQISMRFDNDRQGRDGFMLMGAPTNFIRGFGSYPMGDLGRLGPEQFQAPFSTNGGVSLTLGLQHCENVSFSGSHQAFMSNQVGRGLEIRETNEFDGLNTPTNAHSTNVYGSMSLPNPKRFPAQLLPDFVA